MTVAACLCCTAWALGGSASAWGASASHFSEEGQNTGQLFEAAGVAVDNDASSLSYGDVYVADIRTNRVDRFSSQGAFQLLWGWGVANRADEFQICTQACRTGPEAERGPGAMNYPTGVAVDSDALSPSAGDVYVVDFGNHRVEKFGPSGEFLLAFGGGVNATTGGNVCIAGEACGQAREGSSAGEFQGLVNGANAIAVGPGGSVYVGDRARIQVFEPTGVWRESVSLSGLSVEGQVTALAVDASGDMYVKDSEATGVREFEPSGTEKAVQFDAGSSAVTAVTLDGAGNVFVGDSSSGFHILEYTPAGKSVTSFGYNTVRPYGPYNGIAFSEATDEVYASEPYASVWALPVPAPGPTTTSLSATPSPRGGATLKASIDPENNETEYHFEYVDETEFKSGGFTGAASTPVGMLAPSFEEQQVSAQLSGLSPRTLYHYRIVASNSEGTVGTASGEEGTFETMPPALVDAAYATDVTSSSVTINAALNPLGTATEYALEYGSSTSYGNTIAGSIGEGEGDIHVVRHIQGLSADTVYHYRIVLRNALGTVEGGDGEITTQLAENELVLPDGRSWELVSPANKSGALIEDIERGQAAADGSGIVYDTSEPIGEDISGHVGNSIGRPEEGATILAQRVEDGWRNRDVAPPQALPKEGEPSGPLTLADELFTVFSPDLSMGVFEPDGEYNASLSKEATEPTLYVRHNDTETYEPLVTAANVPAGTKWGPPSGPGEHEKYQMVFQAASTDLSHVVFSDWAALTEDATAKLANPKEYLLNLYEWSAGKLQLVNVLPGQTQGEPGAVFGATYAESNPSAANPWALSKDGRWVVFHYGNIEEQGAAATTWYVRDMVNRKTEQFGRPQGNSRFQTMSRDGARIFYIEAEPEAANGSEQTRGELYMFDTGTEEAIDLTATHLAGERNAEVESTLVGISEDGTSVYFVAKGDLAPGGVRGAHNLYVMRDIDGKWTTTHIATLSIEDEKDWRPGNGFEELTPITRRLTADGRFLAFMSNRSLTGYDNVDAISGMRDEEVYLYDAMTNHLACVSCNPSGARPSGVLDFGQEGKLLMDQSEAWNGSQDESHQGHWLAAAIAPDWHVARNVASYQPRDLSSDGRLFFDSTDALVAQDTNGLADVYEYEPSGVGSCDSSSSTFSEHTGGCVSLISSGQSSSESTFLDASESGDDVFFITAAKLVGADYDTDDDVYDAHVCSASTPCRTEPVSPPPCSSGDSCKAAPSPQPEIFGPTPSATFNGTGNLTGSQATPSVTHRSLSRAQKLARALRVCRKDKGKRRRAVCERQARKRYGARRLHHTTRSSRKGGK